MRRLAHFTHASVFTVAAALFLPAISAHADYTGAPRTFLFNPTVQIPFSDTAKFKKKPPYVIGFANAGLGDSWRVVMQHSLMKAASEHADVIKQLIITNGNMDDAKQAADIQDLISRGVDLLIVSANTQKALDPVVTRAMKQGIPVVMVDRRISSDNFVSFVTGSDAMMGRVWAQWIVEKLHGKGNVIMLAGQAGSSVSADREAAAHEVFAQYPGIKVLDTVYSDWSPVKAKQQMQAMIAKYGHNINAVWCAHGLPVAGSIDAFLAAGFKTGEIPPHTTADLNGPLQLALQYKIPMLEIGYPPSMGSTAIDVALKVLNGEPLPKIYEISPQIALTRGDETASVPHPDQYIDQIVDAKGPPDELVDGGMGPGYNPSTFKVKLPGKMNGQQTVTPAANEGSIRDRIEVLQVTKRFPGVKSLDAVSFGVRAGEIHALVGENGAGKSTLMKVMAGAYLPDEGEIRFDGQPVQWRSAVDAKRRGIHVIYQELVLFPQSSVAENIFAGAEPRSRFGTIDHRRMNLLAQTLLTELGVQLDPRERVGNLSVADQQMVEIAKAMAAETRVLVLDEPTAVIAGKEVQLLFERLRVLRDRGVAIIYISHRLEEIFALCDRVTVMKDGRKVGTQPVSETTRDGLVRMMVGREMSEIYPPKPNLPNDAPTLLAVEGLQVGHRVFDASLAVRAGEIVGLAGMVGSGRTELASGIFGAMRVVRGTVEVRGKRRKRMTPNAAIRLGLGFVTEDRKSQGLLMYLNVAQNVTATTLKHVSRFGLLRAGAERDAGSAAIKEYSIAGARPGGSVATLSGGNQQKVLISRWVRVCDSVLILDEPTRGVDVGAKAEIYRVMRQLTARGLGILMISSELQEVIGMSDRVLVMREGRIAGEVSGERITEHDIMRLATGAQSQTQGGEHAFAH